MGWKGRIPNLLRSWLQGLPCQGPSFQRGGLVRPEGEEPLAALGFPQETRPSLLSLPPAGIAFYGPCRGICWAIASQTLLLHGTELAALLRTLCLPLARGWGCHSPRQQQQQGQAHSQNLF